MSSISFTSKYSNLFQDTTWSNGQMRVKFEYRTELPPSHLISNVNIVPFVGDKGDNWVVIRLQNGTWEIPGGTLEPNETYIEAIRRELVEEAGAHLKSFKLIGAWHSISEADAPYRPHLPFPEFYRVVGVGEIELVQSPGNPPDGEQVVSVECDTLNGVAERFSSIGRYDLKELYELAAELKSDERKR